MEEIPNNHLGCIKPCKQWDTYHINWCRISSINSSTVLFVILLVILTLIITMAEISFKNMINEYAGGCAACSSYDVNICNVNLFIGRVGYSDNDSDK